MASEERDITFANLRLPVTMIDQLKQAARVLSARRQADIWMYMVVAEAFDEWVERHPELFPEVV